MTTTDDDARDHGAKLVVRGAAKRYGDVAALHPTDLSVRTGEFVTLLGPSGSGKTTLLTLIAGLSELDEGALFIDGRDVTAVPPNRRDIGLVFQNYALFPHMSVAENIGFPLKMRKVARAEIDAQVRDALAMVQLPHVADRLPRELSGGQQQRIALARCMIYRPSIILMDEPLGALDKKLRDHMQLEIKRLHKEVGATVIYVTHDQEEAMALSDRICLMNGGRIEQIGTPSDLYFRPRTEFAASFLGESNVFHARVTEAGPDGILLGAPGLPYPIRAAPNGAGPKVAGDVAVMVRPERLQAISVGSRHENVVEGTLLDVMLLGAITKVYVELPGRQIVVASLATRGPVDGRGIGDPIAFGWSPEDTVLVARA